MSVVTFLGLGECNSTNRLAHEWLRDQGILYRDINPGSTLLSMNTGQRIDSNDHESLHHQHSRGYLADLTSYAAILDNAEETRAVFGGEKLRETNISVSFF